MLNCILVTGKYPIFLQRHYHGSQNNRDVNQDENRGDKNDKVEILKMVWI
jgi:hypothetical protein